MFGITRKQTTAGLAAAIFTAAMLSATAATAAPAEHHHEHGVHSRSPVTQSFGLYHAAPTAPTGSLMVDSPQHCLPGHYWIMSGPDGDPGDSDTPMACPG